MAFGPPKKTPQTDSAAATNGPESPDPEPVEGLVEGHRSRIHTFKSLDAIRLPHALQPTYQSAVTLFDCARQMAPSLSRGVICVYILELRSGAFYVGCSADCEERFRQHEAGAACHTSALDPPIALRFIEIHPDLKTARRRETQIKKWSRAKKEALIAHDIAQLQLLSRSRD